MLPGLKATFEGTFFHGLKPVASTVASLTRGRGRSTPNQFERSMEHFTACKKMRYCTGGYWQC